MFTTFQGLFKINETITDEHTGSASVDGTLSTPSNFPVLVHIDSSETDFWNHCSSESEVVFTQSDGTTKLKREVEEFDHTDDDLFAWVKTSLSSSTDTVLYMYYGNASASETDDADTWDFNHKGVWHLNETFGTHYDATTNSNDGAPNGGLNQDATGKIGGADDFDGTDDAVISPDSASLDITNAVTIEAWIYSTDFKNQNPGIVCKWDWISSTPWERSYSLYLMTFKYPCVMVSSNGAYQDQLVSPTPLATNTWYYLTGVFTGSKYIIYINGTLNSELDALATTIYSGPAELSIGSSIENGSISTDETFKGTIDEARVSDTVRSAAWIKTSYNNQNSPSTFYSVGHEEEKPSPSSQRWYLSSTAASWVMYKGDHTKPAGTVPVADDEFQIWIANEAAAVDVGFPANTWTGHVTFDADSLDTTVRVYVGKWDGSVFTPSAGDEYADVSSSSDFSFSAGAFDVPTGEWLAFKIEDYADGDSDSVIVSVGLNNSYLTSPASDPGYPIPELPTIILLGAGLACLGGYIAFMRRKRRVVSP